MKIIFIIPGSGDRFYCGNCFRDHLQAGALRRAGHDVVVMPLYLPLRDRSFQADTPLFFPATSYYVSQKYFKKRRMPSWLEKRVASDFFLKMAASFSGTTSSEGTEGMTLSMINGDDPAFRQQVHTLVDWIQHHEKPDAVHLSSSLLTGIARAVKEAIAVPLVCSLQDEEVWIDTLAEQYARTAWNGILENIKYVDRFIASSEFYRTTILRRFPQIGEVDVVYPGIDTARYASDDYPPDPVIGFFYRMNEANGLHILAEAFAKLKRKPGFDRLRLRIGGGYTAGDKPFLKKIRRTLAPCREAVDWCESYSLSAHAAFYKAITVLCVPVTFDEGVGLYLCEAFAAGRPAVEPDTGSFGEITGNAGVLYTPNEAGALAGAIEKLLTTDGLWEQCRENALHLSRTRYAGSTLATELVRIYRELSENIHTDARPFNHSSEP
ncbi:MAG: glycosyltransferase family 4 protein [Tannerella sp.]|jgi:glycosyltransferase involved in cell wall biosynthesis|nr:glycosyltransferase family 4 protein [Tannerella sp.]